MNKGESYENIMSMPNSLFHNIFTDIREKSMTEEGKKQLADEQMGKAFRGLMG